jgi:hypothetical protein
VVRRSMATQPIRAVVPKPLPKPYKIVCISLYVEDIARLEALVAALKARGNTSASRSGVIRYALEHVDVSTMPKRRRVPR